jgi:hypothetical protein
MRRMLGVDGEVWRLGRDLALRVLGPRPKCAWQESSCLEKVSDEKEERSEMYGLSNACQT